MQAAGGAAGDWLTGQGVGARAAFKGARQTHRALHFLRIVELDVDADVFG